MSYDQYSTQHVHDCCDNSDTPLEMTRISSSTQEQKHPKLSDQRMTIQIATRRQKMAELFASWEISRELFRLFVICPVSQKVVLSGFPNIFSVTTLNAVSCRSSWLTFLEFAEISSVDSLRFVKYTTTQLRISEEISFWNDLETQRHFFMFGVRLREV